MILKTAGAILAFFLFLAMPVAAQDAFEGQIDYVMVSRDSMVRVEISSWYKKDMIKVQIDVKKAPKDTDLKSETLIINFRDSAIDRFKPERKIVEREMMTGKGKKQDIPDLKNSGHQRYILGYRCDELSTGEITKEEMKDSMMVKTKVSISFYYAQELRFPVPDSLLMIQMVPLFTNGRIALGSTIDIEAGPLKFLLSTEAKRVQAKSLRKPVFSYPKGYALKVQD